MFPTPASVRRSRIAALIGAFRVASLSPELLRGEAGLQRFRADTCIQIRLELSGLEQKPGAEPPDIAVGDVRSVVQSDNRTTMRVEGKRSPRLTGSPWRNDPVIRRRTSRARPDSNRTIRYLPRRSTAVTRSPSSSRATRSGSSGRVSRASEISTRSRDRPSRTGTSRRLTLSTSGSSGTGTR